MPTTVCRLGLRALCGPPLVRDRVEGLSALSERLCALFTASALLDDLAMRKALVVVAVVVGLLALAKRFGSKMGGIDWEERLERMPPNAPPVWMFRNIKAIREDTSRIRELLEREGAPETPDP